MSSQADRLIEIRKKYKLSQADFGKVLGLSRAAIANVEGNIGNFKIENYLKLADIYNISLDWLLLGIGSMKLDKSDMQTKIDELNAKYDNLINKLGI